MEDFQFLYDGLSQDTEDSKPKIIIVEDDQMLGLSIKKYLEKVIDTQILLFSNSSDCLKELTLNNDKKPFALVTDISLENGSDGLLLLDILRERKLQFFAIAMTGFASIETAIAATKKGAFHYLTKPFELDNLRTLLIDGFSKIFNKTLSEKDYMLSKKTKVQKVIDKKILLEMPTQDDIFCGIIGRTEIMKSVFEKIKKVSMSDSTVLIQGSSGTGKELVARGIHHLSPRKNHNLINVNCGAIPNELLESELFGHMRGSFTGAISDRKGRFELANSGSIFLDEIGDMPLLLQVKLLRVLQQKQIEVVGDPIARNVNVRVIAATHRNLDQEVIAGNFREDLFYRLNVIPIKVPDLKERRDDIPLLIAYFCEKFSSADRSNTINFSDESLELLLSYDWPGNVRELENVIERLVILRGGNTILAEDLPAKIFRFNPLSSSNYKSVFELPTDGIDIKQVLSDIEDSLIIQALNRTSGNKNQASKLLSLNRTTLIEKMKKKALLFNQ